MRLLSREYILIAAIIFSAPFFVTNVFFSRALYYPILGVLLSLALLTIATRTQSRVPASYFLFVVATFCALCAVGLAHASEGNSSEVGRYLFGLMIKVVFLYVLYTLYVDSPTAFPKAFIKLTYVLCLMVIVFSVLHYTGLWPFSPKLFQYSETKTVHNFYLTFSSSVRVIDGFIYPRLSSFLDEPGSFAMLCATALLLAYKIGYGDRGIVLVVVIAGMLSFSLAFYIFLCMYALLDARWNRIASAVLVLIGMYVLYTRVPAMNSMGDLILNRLEFSNGNFSGDNRFQYSQWPHNLAFGDGLVGHRDSIINEIRNWGIVGVTANYAPLFFVVVFGDLRAKKIAIVFLVLMTQRPVIDKLYIYFPIIWMAIDTHLRRSNET